MIKRTKKEIKELQKREKELRDIVDRCKDNRFSGVIFDRELGHICFYNNETDRHSLIELAKTEDEFVKQMRQASASLMVKSHHDNVEKLHKELGLSNKKKPSYMG